jgi:HK97 family phage prohead protease
MAFKSIETKADGSVRIKGFASTPDLDRYDDVVNPTAFASAMVTYMKNPVVLLGHDSDKPIGTVIEYNLSNNGLEVTAEIVNDTDGVLEKIQNKTLRGFSIGWICKNCIFREENNRSIREITSLDLVEISVVATPANPSTLFTLAKSLKKFFDKKAIEKKSEDDGGEVEEEINEENQPTGEEATGASPDEAKEAEVSGESAEPVAPEVSEVAEEETSEVVQADEEPTSEASAEVLDEVKALVDTMIQEAIEKVTAPLLAQNAELKTAIDALEKKHNDFSESILSVEVSNSNRMSKKHVVLTYGMLR